MLKKALFTLVLSAMFFGAGSVCFAGNGSCNFDSDCGGTVKCKQRKCSTAAGPCRSRPGRARSSTASTRNRGQSRMIFSH